MHAQPTLAHEDLYRTPGDALLLVTDGVTEARGVEECYGELRLDAVRPTVVRG